MGRVVKLFFEGGRGDQYVTISVRVPEKLTAEQREMLERFGESWSPELRGALLR